MSDTPRTDAVIFGATFAREAVESDFARQLERELAEAREQLEDFEVEATNAINDIMRVKYQRDTLAEAAQAVVDRWDATTWKELESTAKLMNALRKAIAAAKGGEA